jgi:hypothetical protein
MLVSGDSCIPLVQLLASQCNDQAPPAYNTGLHDVQYLNLATGRTELSLDDKLRTSLLDSTLSHADSLVILKTCFMCCIIRAMTRFFKWSEEQPA